MNSIVFSGETGSSLEIGGEKTTFNIHFSPIFYLIAPFKFFYFSEYTPDIIQILSFLIGVFLLLNFFGCDYWSSILLIAGFFCLPQTIGLLFTSFRTIKLSFLLIIWFYIALKKNKLAIIPFLLLLSLIEINYILCIGLLIYSFSFKNIYRFHLIAILLILFFSIASLKFLNCERHLTFLDFSGFNYIEAVRYLSRLLAMFIFLPLLDKTIILVIPYISIILFSNISEFFNFSEIKFMPKINFYYIIPILTVFLIILIKKRNIAKISVTGKRIYFIPLAFFILATVYGIDEKKIFFDKLNFDNNIERDRIVFIKKQIPINSNLITQWLYVDLFSEYQKLHFYTRVLNNPQYTYIFLDLNQPYLDIDTQNANQKNSDIANLKSLVNAGKFKTLIDNGRYLLLYCQSK